MDFVFGKIGEVIQGLIASVWAWIIGPFKDLRTFEDLIYGKDKDESLAFGIFTDKELTGIFGPGVTAITILSITAILIGIIIWGMRISQSGINPSSRTRNIEFFLDLIIVALLFWNLPALYELLFGVNYTIVGLFDAAKDGELIKISDEIKNNNDVLGNLIIQLCLLGLAIWANFYYMMRKLTLMIFMILGPLMVGFYLIPQTKLITLGWIKELIGTIFVQSIHAILFWIVSLMAVSSSGIEAVILYVVFIPTAEALRSLFGLGGQTHNNLSKAGAMFGMSALAGVYGAAKGAMNGKSVTETLKGAYKGLKGRKGSSDNGDPEGQKGLAANLGTDTGSTSLGEKMLKAGDLVSKGGKAVVGMAGSIAGSPMGPSGSILGAAIGSEIGSVTGGVAGRAALLAGHGIGKPIGKAFSGFKKGVSNAWNSDKRADDELADRLAEDETAKWAEGNKQSFFDTAKERFPDADEKSLMTMWDQEVSSKKAAFKEKARAQIQSIRKNDGKMAKADSLVSSGAAAITDKWANENKEAFFDKYDKEHPLPSEATPEQRAQHHSARDDAWNQKLNSKSNEFNNMASELANAESNGNPLSGSFINKKDFAKKLALAAFKDQKAGFISDYMKQNPSANLSDAENAFADKFGSDRAVLGSLHAATEKGTNKVAGAKLYSGSDVNSGYLLSQMAALKTNEAKNKFINNHREQNSLSSTNDLVNQAATGFTNDWASKNAVAFKQKFDQMNPLSENASEIEVKAHEQRREQAWQNAVAAQKSHYSQIATEAAKSIAGEDLTSSTLVKKGTFLEAVSSKAFDADKKIFESKVTDKNAVPNFSRSLSDYSNIAGHAISSVPASTLGSLEDAEKSWNNVSHDNFVGNLNDLKQGSAAFAPLSHAVVSKKTALGAAAVATAVGSGVKQGFLEGSNYKTISNFVKDSKVGKTSEQFITSMKENLNNAQSEHGSLMQSIKTNGLQGVQDSIIMPISSAAAQGIDVFKNHVPADVVDRHVGFKNSVALAGGLIGGIVGYQKGAKAGLAVNPYKKATNQRIAEVSEIQQMAESFKDATGKKHIADGAIQLVTNDNESFIQVRDKTGHFRVVSRKGSGDSTLNKGQVLYQNLGIENGMLQKMTNPFSLDSAGGKILHNKNINVDPNKLVGDRTGKVPFKNIEIQSFNQMVDSGQFYLNDITANQMRDIQMVVERSRSYVTATDHSGNAFRISPYGNGDTRLADGQQVFSKCSISNKKLSKIGTPYTIENEQEVPCDYTSTLNPSDLIRIKPNKRLSQRREKEIFRHKGIGGAL
ncbi:type IV secretion system protein [Bacillus swezeyi]|uniref:Type IV secretion system protein n=1 Tax=Bacillus swezeyi TaxID=1925020 RepID=A0A5M8RHW7_9BACI|nr:type IV secretion system protein [Bacillus swezeyi]KAA6446990.1 hypothetical protein DX927_23385 [Bacillus swezeyi]KAA6471558.1 hypothetical protein DX928_23625 [Bacillus swezeyi]